ncbi:hypothetical protein [Microbispora sp. H10670]|uniref:hypothetical protein n=1 Tax=Microbispora sp. H10670 TaxID=2729108 RepID=UPI0021760456|nr:hypothetical protein [Microbispora sp. H10670]
MARQVRTTPGAAYDLGYHAEFPHLRSQLPTLGSGSYVGAVCARAVQPYIEMWYERSPLGDGCA